MSRINRLKGMITLNRNMDDRDKIVFNCYTHTHIYIYIYIYIYRTVSEN